MAGIVEKTGRFDERDKNRRTWEREPVIIKSRIEISGQLDLVMMMTKPGDDGTDKMAMDKCLIMLVFRYERMIRQCADGVMC